MGEYSLGPVKPHVAAAAKEIGDKFNVSTIYGFAQRTYSSDHPLGLALDFMVYGDRAKGDAIANYAQANAARLGISYIIWYQRIWSVERSGEGWRAMENRGGITANHMDHPHISFDAKAGATVPIVNPGGGLNIPNPLGAGADLVAMVKGLYDVAQTYARIASWVANPQNIVRINLFIAGVILMVIAVVKATGASSKVADTAKTVGKAVATNAKP